MNEINYIKSIDKRVIAVEQKIFALLITSFTNLVAIIAVLILK